MEKIVALQGEWTAIAVVLLAAAIGGLILWTIKSAAWIALLLIVWSVTWVLVMPAGIPTAKLVIDQASMKDRFACTRQVASELDYWNEHRPLALAANCQIAPEPPPAPTPKSAPKPVPPK